MLYPSLHFRVLETLESAPYFFEDLFLIFSATYGSSFRAIQRRLDEAHGVRPKKLTRCPRRSFSDIVYRLKRDGLIESKVSDGSKTVAITKDGKNLLHKLRLRKSDPMFVGKYVREEDGNLKIITFDVPEKYKHKRNWLRAVITNLGFSIVQKSVWIGTAGIPGDFLEDLNKLKMVGYIEIFSVSKKGTLDKIDLGS